MELNGKLAEDNASFWDMKYI